MVSPGPGWCCQPSGACLIVTLPLSFWDLFEEARCSLPQLILDLDEALMHCRGEVSDYVLMEGRGFGFVTYRDPQHAQQFLEVARCCLRAIL